MRTKALILILILIITAELFGLTLFHSYNFSVVVALPPEGTQTSLVMVAKYANVYADVRINIVPNGNGVELRFPNGTNINVTSRYSLAFTMPNTESFQRPSSSEMGSVLMVDSSDPITAIAFPGINSTYYGPQAMKTFGAANVFYFDLVGNAIVDFSIYGVSL
jgi:hypothetical protein